MYDYERARKIIRQAGAGIKDPATRSLLLADERGTFEKMANEYLTTTAVKAAELGMSPDQVDAEIADRIAYLALTAMIEHRTKKGTTKKRKGR